MRRSCSKFPGGRVGAGLLLLRALVGLIAIFQGAAYFEGGNMAVREWVIGIPTILGGTSLLIGFLTPILGTMIGLEAVGIVFCRLPAQAPNPFSAPLPTVMAVVAASVVVLLGPGALSVDARLFGMREIVITRTDESPGA